jgi:hypothetical protein
MRVEKNLLAYPTPKHAARPGPSSQGAGAGIYG